MRYRVVKQTRVQRVTDRAGGDVRRRNVDCWDVKGGSDGVQWFKRFHKAGFAEGHALLQLSRSVPSMPAAGGDPVLDWDYSELGPFVFDRGQYEQAIADAMAQASDSPRGTRSRRYTGDTLRQLRIATLRTPLRSRSPWIRIRVSPAPG